MNETTHRQKQNRFLRDVTPYLEELNEIIRRLAKMGDDLDASTAATVDLIRDSYDYLAECRETLRMAEQMVTEARANHAPPEKIENLVSICRKLQNEQMKLANSIMKHADKMLNKISPV